MRDSYVYRVSGITYDLNESHPIQVMVTQDSFSRCYGTSPIKLHTMFNSYSGIIVFKNFKPSCLIFHDGNYYREADELRYKVGMLLFQKSPKIDSSLSYTDENLYFTRIIQSLNLMILWVP